MKIKFALGALAIAFAASSATAGDLSPVMIETPPAPVVSDSGNGSMGLLLPLLLIGGLVALAGSSSSSGT